MIRLYAYPKLFGLPDNNPYGLKVDTFLRLTKIDYKLENILDTSKAPRGQLPYLIDGENQYTDSNLITNYLADKYNIRWDESLTTEQHNIHYLITSMLDNHLYWVMSYSRWQDDYYWPIFRDQFIKEYPDVTKEILNTPKEYNSKKYHFQGIGRYSPEEIYQQGIADLEVLLTQLGQNKYMFGDSIHTIDACCYGFLANIYYFKIDTPLRQFIKQNKPLSNYIERIRTMLDY